MDAILSKSGLTTFPRCGINKGLLQRDASLRADRFFFRWGFRVRSRRRTGQLHVCCVVKVVLFASCLLFHRENSSFFFLANFATIGCSGRLKPDGLIKHRRLHRPGRADTPQLQWHSPEGLQAPGSRACACACACVPVSRIWLARAGCAEGDSDVLPPNDIKGTKSNRGGGGELLAPDTQIAPTSSLT